MLIKDYRTILHANSQDELRSRLPETRVSRAAPLTAYINHARIVADCTVCGAGVACALDEDDATCMGCGTIHRITRPDPAELEAVMQVLMQRPDETKFNWRPGESRDQLAAENWTNGWPTEPPASRAKRATQIERDTARVVTQARLDDRLRKRRGR